MVFIGERREQLKAGVDFVAGQQRIGAGEGEGKGFLRFNAHVAGVRVSKQAEIGQGFGGFLFCLGRSAYAMFSKRRGYPFAVRDIHAVFAVFIIFAREKGGIEMVVEKGEQHNAQAGNEAVNIKHHWQGKGLFTRECLFKKISYQVLLQSRL